MGHRDDVREFLVSRRAKVTPDQVGLGGTAGRRRVPGLRREEVASLAGVSVDYYIRLERGNLGGVSESVLDALANALLLDQAEREHLYDLARAADRSARNRSGIPAVQVRPSIRQLLDAITGAPAYVRSRRRDVLATNDLGRALFVDLYRDPVQPPNLARFVFFGERSRTFYSNWSRAADDTVAALRTEAGRNPYDRSLSDLIGELATRSEEFAGRWATHNVKLHRSGIKEFRHPVVGDLRLDFEALDLPSDPGLALIVYSAAPGTGTADALTLLASWAATQAAGVPDDHEASSNTQDFPNHQDGRLR